MKIEKISNSTYRVRQQYQGHRFTIIFDHKPSAKEVNIALAEKMSLHSSNYGNKATVESMAIKYTDKLREDGKSPSTLRGYTSILNNTPAWFLNLKFYEVENKDIQKLVDEYKKGRSAKTVSNLYGFYRAIYSEYRPEMVFKVKIPTKEKKFEYEPSTTDIMNILEIAKGTRYSVFIQLSVLGLRRGEIAALTLDDLSKENILTINKDMIIDENNNHVIKNTPKTSASNRRILIPASLAEEIREQGFIFEGNMHTVNEALHKYQDQLNIPRFRLHILRHFAGAYLLKQGFNKEQIFEYCGWEKGSQVFDRIYSYNLDPEESQKNIADKFSSLF